MCCLVCFTAYLVALLLLLVAAAAIVAIMDVLVIVCGKLFGLCVDMFRFVVGLPLSCSVFFMCHHRWCCCRSHRRVGALVVVIVACCWSWAVSLSSFDCALTFMLDDCHLLLLFCVALLVSTIPALIA